MSAEEPGRPPPDMLRDLAADAYVYGSPLVRNILTVDACLRRGLGFLPPSPFNEFAHMARPATPEERQPSATHDTLYSVAQVDVTAGPVYLHVPDTGGAYHVLQFIDAWTDNFAYLGSRATGTQASDWLVVPAGWEGEAPGTVRGVIEAPTSVVTVVGRFAVHGPSDLPRVRGLQERLALTPPPASQGGDGLPAPDPVVRQELVFFERLRTWAAWSPPGPSYRAHLERFRPLGLLQEGRSPYATADSTFVRALVDGLAAGRERVVEAAREPAAGPAGEWRLNPHRFDYNVDHLGIGTVDSGDWRIEDREQALLARATASRTSPWGTHGYESLYAVTWTDAAGETLNGSRSYTLRFPEPPPVDAFWSLTMYDAPDYLLVPNQADRYAISDRTPGLVYGPDGSLTLFVQRERPQDPDEAANWLPAPAGDFRPMARLYVPRAEALDGRYRLPPLRAR